jgi:cytochrome P450
MFGKTGIFNSDGMIWYRSRKIASKIFTSNRFKAMFDVIFPQNIKKLIARINYIKAAPVDLHMLLHQYFLDSFAQVAFGVFFN